MDQEHMQIDVLDYTLHYRDTCSCENWNTANLNYLESQSRLQQISINMIIEFDYDLRYIKDYE